MVTIVEFLNARLDERESGVRHELRTEDYGVSQFDLDDISSKRAIVAWCGEREQIWVGTIGSNPELPNPKDFVPGHLRNPADSIVLRYLASVYSDHPDYNEEWKP